MGASYRARPVGGGSSDRSQADVVVDRRVERALAAVVGVHRDVREPPLAPFERVAGIYVADRQVVLAPRRLRTERIAARFGEARGRRMHKRCDRGTAGVVGVRGGKVSTTEYSTIDSPCPCGQGTIAVTRSEPDHGYVRASQIGYSAKILCGKCSDFYEIRGQEYERFPSVVRRSDADRQRTAQERLEALEKDVMASDAVGRLRQRIVAAVDGEPTMAAAHRVLQRFGLARETVSVCRKRHYGGEEAVRYAGAVALSRIGSMGDMGQADACKFDVWACQLASLEEDVRKLEPDAVKTAGVWFRE